MHRVDTGLVDMVLPTAEEASRIARQPLESSDGDDTPFHGGPDILFDGARDDRDITPFECESTVTVFSRATYSGSSLTAAARVLYYSTHRGQNVFSADAMSFRFASAEDARRMLSTLAERWRRCSGKTVKINGETDVTNFVTVSNVSATATLLSENTVSRRTGNNLPKFWPRPAQRAVSVASDVIVVAIVEMDADYGPPAPVGNRAIDLVKLMARKISGRM